MDFYGTVADGDAEAVERVCTRLIDDLKLTVTAAVLAVAWGERFFETVGACRVRGFRSLYTCECDSLVTTCAPMCGRIDPRPYVDELVRYMAAPTLHADAKDVLMRLDLPVCCVSNADTDPLHAAITHHDLPFAAVVCSENVLSYKPEPMIFERALDAMSLKAGEVLHVGDSLHSDVTGGRRAGIDTAWIERRRRIHDVGSARATYNIRSLKELYGILA